MTKEYPWGKGTPTFQRDAVLNDSDKTFTVPAGKVWDLKYIGYSLTATATVGNRAVNCIITNGTNVVWGALNSANITANLQAGAYMHFGTFCFTTAAAHYTVGAGINGVAVASQSAPEMILPAGFTIRVADLAAIDAAADDLIVVLHYVEYTA